LRRDGTKTHGVQFSLRAHRPAERHASAETRLDGKGAVPDVGFIRGLVDSRVPGRPKSYAKPGT
jgi:hypothetical protein